MPFTSIGSAKITQQFRPAGTYTLNTDVETKAQKGKVLGSLITAGCWSWESVHGFLLALTGQVMEGPPGGVQHLVGTEEEKDLQRSGSNHGL